MTISLKWSHVKNKLPHYRTKLKSISAVIYQRLSKPFRIFPLYRLIPGMNMQCLLQKYDKTHMLWGEWKLVRGSRDTPILGCGREVLQ